MCIYMYVCVCLVLNAIPGNNTNQAHWAQLLAESPRPGEAEKAGHVASAERKNKNKNKGK